MQGHSFRLDELTRLEKQLVEMQDGAAVWSDPLGEAVKLVQERGDEVRKDAAQTNPMYPKGSSAYAE